MADEKITQLTADTAPTTDDLTVIVNDPAGTPGTKKVTLSNLFTVIWAAVTNAATAKTTPADGDKFSIVDSAASNVIKSLSWLKLRQNLNADGWIPVTDTWTYASASTITIPTDGTLVYQKGVKIRFKQGGSFKYYVGKTVAATLLTVITNTDYTIANAAITDISYSYIENPFGWPDYFNYSPTAGGAITIGNGTTAGRYKVSGLSIKWYARVTFGNTSAMGSGIPTLTNPATLAAPYEVYRGFGTLLDSGTAKYNAVVEISTSAASFLMQDDAGAFIANIVFSSTLPMTWTTNDSLSMEGEGILA